MKNRITDFTIVLLIIGVLCFIAQNSSASDGNRRPAGPPPEAIKACSEKKVGDPVTFTGRRGEELKATCQEIDGQIAAVPDNFAGERPKG